MRNRIINTLDNLLEGYQLISFDWEYIYINKTAARQGQSSREELLGHKMMEKYPGIENTEMFRTLKKCMQNRVSDRMENEFSNLDGSNTWFELRIEPVSEGLFILSIDISEQKNAQRKLLELNESLEQIVLFRTSELEMKNKSITDSLVYAKRIQQAKFPDKEKFYNAFPQSLVLFKPKDIVSGDFYYFHKGDQKIFIASADCTGHGVPGALMSMIGFEKLDEALTHSTNTSRILSFLNKGIKSSLQQSDKNESTRDGMDIALCSINPKSRVVEYAGANLPMWIIRKGQTEIEVIRATRKAIGGYTDDDQHFDTHEMKFKEGDTFYISTDGYADTFGGQENKKLKTKKFKEILLSIQKMTMHEQAIYLDNFIERWRAEEEQVDDILVLGVRF